MRSRFPYGFLHTWRYLGLAAGLAMLVVLTPPAARAELPFLTEEAETLAPAAFTFDAGVRVREEARDFGVEDRDRQYDLGVFRFSFGVGRLVELQVSGVAVAAIDEGGETSTNSGDWVFGTKIWMLQEKKRRPSLSFLYEVKLPNGSDEDGGATDETDFFGYLIASKKIGRRDHLHGNLGLGILGNPFANSEQNDVFIVRLAWERKLSETKLFGLEATARGGPQEDDDPRFVRAVYAQKIKKWVVHGGVGVGIGDESDDFTLDLGVRRRLGLWRPKVPTRENPW